MQAFGDLLRKKISGEEREPEAYVDTFYDDGGETEILRTRRAYTPRGERMKSLERPLSVFMEARAQVLDRIAAERAIQKMLD